MEKQKIEYTIALALLLLIIIQFLGWQVAVIVIFFMFCLLFLQLYKGKVYKLPAGLLLILILTFATYFLQYSKNNHVNAYNCIVFLLGAPMLYYSGMVVTRYCWKDMDRMIENVLLVLALGGSLYAFSCILNKYLHTGLYMSLFYQEGISSVMKGRYGLDIWTQTLFHPTNLNSFCIFAIASWYPAVHYVRSKIKRILFYTAGFLALMVSLTTASRTNIVFAVISVFVYILFERSYQHKGKTHKLTRNQVICILLVVLAVFLFSDKIYSIMLHTALGKRLKGGELTVANDGRWIRMKTVIDHLWEYPNGNMPFTFAHNIWLDVARVSGIIPMVFMMAYTIEVFTLAFLTANRKTRITNSGKWLSMVIIIVFVSFQIEPVLEGRPYIFMLFCYLAGSLVIYRKQMRVS